MSVPTAPRLLRRLHGEHARELLQGFVERQRWYGGKGRTIAGIRLVDCVPLREGEVEICIVLAQVDFEGGGGSLLHLPLTRRALVGSPVSEVEDPALIAVFDDDGVATVIHDAMADAESVEAVFAAIIGGERHRGIAGEVRFRALPAAGPGARRLARAGTGVTVRPLGKEQSNSAAVRGDGELLKCLRRVGPGTNPELEMTEALAAAGFADIATPLGAVDYLPDGGGEDGAILLATVQAYLHNGTDGFAMALTSLRDLFAAAEDSWAPGEGGAAPEKAVRRQGATFVPEAVRIGALVGSMHAALSRDGLPPALCPQAVGPALLTAWADEFSAELDDLLALGSPAVAPLRAHRERIEAAYRAMRELRDGGLAIRVHGDLHLGQLLRIDSGWNVLDFEGEPARPLEVRRRHSSPLNDVAGMLRSLDYAAGVALADRVGTDHADREPLVALGDAWVRVNGEALWDSYVHAVAGRGLLPGFAASDVLRQAFVTRKAVYEVGYELRNRPDWAGIPLRYLLGIATGTRR